MSSKVSYELFLAKQSYYQCLKHFPFIVFRNNLGNMAVILFIGISQFLFDHRLKRFFSSLRCSGYLMERRVGKALRNLL